MGYVLSRTPRLDFGSGSFSHIPSLIAEYRTVSQAQTGSDPVLAILVRGGSSFLSSPQHTFLLDAFKTAGLGVMEFACTGEPSPAFVDGSVLEALHALDGRSASQAMVISVGGGSAMDAGKALAAMLPLASTGRESGHEAGRVSGCGAGHEVERKAGQSRFSVTEYLEGVGTKIPPGASCFHIAVPTTAGTGSEATKNAVISQVGEQGFKKSLRHEGYVPSIAVVDGDLALSCPRSVTAASGLDALTQLLEAWFSPLASALTTAWCETGVAHFARSFTQVLSDPGNREARSGMALASYLSGVGLANAGLGSVHALASPVGGRFPVPHGVVCGLLLEPAMRLNASLLADMAATGNSQGETAQKVLAKMARAGEILGAAHPGAAVLGAAIPAVAPVVKGLDLAATLLDLLASYTEIARLPRMGGWGVKSEDLDALAAKASTKTNPVPLTPADYRELLSQVL